MATAILDSPSTTEVDTQVQESASELLARGRELMLLYDIDGYQQAVCVFREGLELFCDDGILMAALGETYAYWAHRREILGQESDSYYTLAYNHAMRAIELAPDLGEAHRALSAALSGGEHCDPQRRIKEALCALELNPYNSETCYELWRARGYRLEDSAIYKAIALNPALCAAHNDLGFAFFEAGRLDQACYHIEQALKLNPRNTLVRHNLAAVLLRQGRQAQAQQVLKAGGA